MAFRWSWIATLLLSTSAVAQPAPQQPDLNTVLQAIQSLGKEVKTLREDVNKLKEPPQQAAQPTTTPATQSKASLPAKDTASQPQTVRGQLRSGWIVSVYDSDSSGCCSINVDFGGDAIGSFPYEKMTFDNQFHKKAVPTANTVGYKAEAFFRAHDSGRYVFLIKFISESGCRIGLDIEGTSVRKLPNGVPHYVAEETIQAGIDLTPGDFKIALYIICNQRNWKNEIKLFIRGPQDMLPRDVEQNEIVYVVRPRHRSSADPTNSFAEAPPAARGQAPFTGHIARVISTNKLRIDGQSAPVLLNGVLGFGPPHNVKLRQFIDSQGGMLTCDPAGSQYVCRVKNVDIGLAAIANGAAKASDDAPPSYRSAELDARQHTRGVWQTH